MSGLFRNRFIATGLAVATIAAGAGENSPEFANAEAMHFGDAGALVTTSGAKIALAPAVKLATDEERAKRFADCEEAVLEKPEFGLQKIPTKVKEDFTGFPGGGLLPPLVPYVTLEKVSANGKVCNDGMVQRIVTLFEKIDGGKYPVLTEYIGNGYEGHYITLIASRSDLCGKTVQAGVKVEANLDEVRRLGDPAIEHHQDSATQVYLAEPRQVVCNN